MADLEAVLADVSYLMAMEKSKSTPAASASKKIILPDRTFVSTSVLSRFLRWTLFKLIWRHVFLFVRTSSSVRSVTHKHLQKMYENTFDKIFNQQIGKNHFPLI